MDSFDENDPLKGCRGCYFWNEKDYRCTDKDPKYKYNCRWNEERSLFVI